MIEAVYGSYGFWSWLRYWYLDTENFVELMLLDRVYQDYDYSEPKEKPKKLTAEEKKIWSREKLMAVLGRAIDPATGRGVFEKPQAMTAEEMQRIAMEDEKRETKQ